MYDPATKMMKKLRVFRVVFLFFSVTVLIVSTFQILSFMLSFIWNEQSWFRQAEIVTIDPWVKKHWNHVKILSDTVHHMQVFKTILLWTKFFGASDFVPKLSSLGCSVSKCFVTSDRKYLNKSDALIFHLRDISLDDMPVSRSPKQIWIILHHESPPHTPEFLKEMSGVFNWTATYRFDSEILLTPVVKKLNKEITDNANYAKGKKKMVAWFVSNCETPSNREGFVKELQKSIPVDVYGKCGQFSCIPKMSWECYEKVAKIYRFYLSFENSICKDYVTEKFFHILSTNMVPIVMGGANYSHVAPPSSYIDALAFKTPRDLAHFLIKVAKNDDLYNSYFAWKKTHYITIEHYACQICKKLHEPPKLSYYINISSWWFQDAHCRTWSSNDKL